MFQDTQRTNGRNFFTTKKRHYKTQNTEKQSIPIREEEETEEITKEVWGSSHSIAYDYWYLGAPFLLLKNTPEGLKKGIQRLPFVRNLCINAIHTLHLSAKSRTTNWAPTQGSPQKMVYRIKIVRYQVRNGISRVPKTSLFLLL